MEFNSSEQLNFKENHYSFSESSLGSFVVPIPEDSEAAIEEFKSPYSLLEDFK